MMEGKHRMELLAGIDFGGSSAKIGLVDERGKIVSRTGVVMDPSQSFEGIVLPVADGLRKLLLEQGDGAHLRVIGIGTPGFIDKNEGMLIGGCDNIPALQHRSVQNYIAHAFKTPTFAENDATSAAAGELAYGAGKSFSHFLLITLGTAIGGGLVLGGRVYRGWRGFAGEVGHLCMSPGGLWCGCGSRGCFEQYASGRAMARIYAEKRKKRASSDADRVTPKVVVQRAVEGDLLARDTLEETGRWIAQAFGGILNVLDLQACIVGGGVSEAGEMILEPIRRNLPDFTWPEICKDVRVLAAELGNDAGILGAAAQAVERLQE